MGHPAHRTVLVGIGDADLPEAALRYAAAEAVRRGLGVRLVHVAHPPVAPVAPEQLLIGFEAADLVGRQVLTGAQEHLVRLVEGLLDEQAGGHRTREQQDAVPVEVDNQRGSVVPRLLDLCTGAEELVLEHRAWSRMHRVLTGSVVTGVACRAHVPVVAVPEGWTPPEQPHGRVVVGLASTTDADALLARAFEQARSRAAELVVVHGWYLPSAYDDVIVERMAAAEWRERADRAFTEHLLPWRETHPDVAVRVDVPHLHPADALVGAARTADLVLVGPHGHGRGGPLPHLGSVARGVLREAPCPVEIVGEPVPAHHRRPAGASAGGRTS